MHSKTVNLESRKSHFIVKQGIVLGHIVSMNGLEVDKVKIDIITKLFLSLQPRKFDPSLVIDNYELIVTSIH